MEVDGLGGEFNAFTSKEYTGYYVKCAAEYRDRALDVLVDMLRNSKFESEEIEREKGVIVEEMNMYYDTPRDFIGGVYDQLLYGDQPLGWDIIGKKETVRAATRDTFLGYVDRWYKPERMVVGLGGRLDGDPLETVAAAARRPRGAGDRSAAAGRGRARLRAARDDPPQGVRPGAPLPRRAQLPARPPGPLRAAAALDRARHRHVVAALHRGARAARARLLRLRAQPELHRRGLALLAGRRRHQPRRRGGRDDRARVPPDRRRGRPGGGAREGARARQGPLRAPAREPAGDDDVRAQPRGARGHGGRAGGDHRRPRRGHRRGRPARRAGRDRQRRDQPRADRPVRGRRRRSKSYSSVARSSSRCSRSSASATRAASSRACTAWRRASSASPASA